MITKPELPPKYGYVEVETETGQREYQKVHTVEDDMLLQQAQIKAASARQDFLEDCIAEMATQVYS